MSDAAQATAPDPWDELVWPELPIWSPNGSRIAFLHGSIVYVVNSDGTGQAAIVDLKGIQPFQPQWSPDGARLAFEARTPGTTTTSTW